MPSLQLGARWQVGCCIIAFNALRFSFAVMVMLFHPFVLADCDSLLIRIRATGRSPLRHARCVPARANSSLRPTVAFNNSGNVITVAGGAYCTGMSWNNASDRSVKENITPVNNEDILYGISQVPICRWNYKSDPKSTTHIGPMAQDFKAVFNTGADDKTISTIDPAGIALAGIQALLKRIEAMQKEIMKLKERLKVRNDDNKKKTCY